MLVALKPLIKKLPGVESVLREREVRAVSARYQGMSPHQIFSSIYDWKCGEFGPDSSTLDGATPRQTRAVAQQLPGVLEQFDVRSVLDVGCGDFTWMSHADLAGVRYTGLDFLAPTQEKNARFARPGVDFVVADMLSEALPQADLVLCRDVFVHFSDARIGQAMDNIKRSGATWLLATTFPEKLRNFDCATGGWRAINFQRAPWGWPRPAALIVERVAEAEFSDKALGLWRLSDL
ncbi:MAG: class I SAM-dependent methyltransferase [Betaproteobacteria bacterium]|nr:class I SAM-dependent methyltransferase [Betaproteobacteria bacterium]